MADEQTLTEVLVDCVKAAGGSKVVGARLFPDLLVDQAQRKLLDCLNDERPHRLSPEQVLLVAALPFLPLLATTFIPAGESEPLNDPEEIRERYEKVLDAIVDAGGCPQEPTTVVDLTPMGTGGDPEVVREGRGSLQALGL